MSSVSAPTALKITQVVQLAFMIGMCYFPTLMMQGYQGDVFTGTGKTYFTFSMGIFGIQMMLSAIITISSSKDYVPKNQQSVACLCNALIWAAFILLDGRWLLGIPGPLPQAIPAPSIAGNLVLFAAMSALNVMGWKSSGSAMPNFDSLMFKGPAKMPLIVGCLNLLFFAVGCGFATEQFLEMYLPGVMASVPASANVAPMVHLILGNAGKLMLMNMASMLAIASVGDESTSHRLLRLSCFVNLFYMGSVTREHIINDAVGWNAPMYAMSFAQCFAVTFYQCSAFGAQSALKVKAH